MPGADGHFFDIVRPGCAVLRCRVHKFRLVGDPLRPDLLRVHPLSPPEIGLQSQFFSRADSPLRHAAAALFPVALGPLHKSLNAPRAETFLQFPVKPDRNKCLNLLIEQLRDSSCLFHAVLPSMNYSSATEPSVLYTSPGAPPLNQLF